MCDWYDATTNHWSQLPDIWSTQTLSACFFLFGHVYTPQASKINKFTFNSRRLASFSHYNAKKRLDAILSYYIHCFWRAPHNTVYNICFWIFFLLSTIELDRFIEFIANKCVNIESVTKTIVHIQSIGDWRQDEKTNGNRHVWVCVCARVRASGSACAVCSAAIPARCAQHSNGARRIEKNEWHFVQKGCYAHCLHVCIYVHIIYTSVERRSLDSQHKKGKEKKGKSIFRSNNFLLIPQRLWWNFNFGSSSQRICVFFHCFNQNLCSTCYSIIIMGFSCLQM